MHSCTYFLIGSLQWLTPDICFAVQIQKNTVFICSNLLEQVWLCVDKRINVFIESLLFNLRSWIIPFKRKGKKILALNSFLWGGMDFLWDFVWGGQVVLFIYGRLFMEDYVWKAQMKVQKFQKLSSWGLSEIRNFSLVPFPNLSEWSV